MTERTVLHIVGPAWSGSSLLNALLNTQPSIAGLGEAHHFRDPDRGVAWCSRCRRPVTRATCHLAARIDPARLYGSIFDALPAKNVLVDASKALHLGVQVADDGEDRTLFQQKAILLTKHPGQWVPSAMRHEHYSVEAAFEMWMYVVGNSLSQLIEHVRLPFLSLCYDDLVADPAGAVESICRFLKVAYDPHRVPLWYQTETCIAGGNMAVYLQFADQTRLQAGEAGDWYRDLTRMIRRDDRWLADHALRSQCLAMWQRHEPRLTELMRRLGHRTGWPAEMPDPAGSPVPDEKP